MAVLDEADGCQGIGAGANGHIVAVRMGAEKNVEMFNLLCTYDLV